MTTGIFRIHPAIGIARVGNAEEFYLAPETAAGEKLSAAGDMGGLPIKAGTENTPIQDTDLRDASGAVKRQAARFRIYHYPDDMVGSYPTDEGEEVTIGSVIGDWKVTDITWTVHVANKKLNNFVIDDAGPNQGLAGYDPPNTPPVRNPGYAGSSDLNDTTRLTQLVIDPGPRAIKASAGAAQVVAFKQDTVASYGTSDGAIATNADYPQSFPADHHKLYAPLGPVDSLGDVRVDDKGRLIVAGGYGRAAGVITDGDPPPLNEPTENGLWFDDTSDGPVDAVLTLTSVSNPTITATAGVVGGWVVTGDPGYAPQTRNVVSAWDDIFDVWVRELNLIPDLYADGKYNTSFPPSFPFNIQPIFHAAMLQRWNTNLPNAAINAHDMIGAIKPSDDPSVKIPRLDKLIRNPNGSAEEIQTGSPLMPLSLGDMGKSFLTVSQTQYFFLTRWHAKLCADIPFPLGPGERLDYVTLANCLGGRYSPGIEVSFPVRDTHLYNARDVATTGPFRINAKPMDYSTATTDKPFLSCGYVPKRDHPVEPGDVSKFMSVPWHTDYNSCAVHLPDPNPNLKTGATNPDGSPTTYPNNTLYWSWPAERPVQVHPANLCEYDEETKTWSLGGQVFSIRGVGTETDYPADAGRYQKYPDYLMNWHKVGFIIQGGQITDTGGKPSYGNDFFLEVQSQFDGNGPLVQKWPTANVPPAPGTT